MALGGGEKGGKEEQVCNGGSARVQFQSKASAAVIIIIIAAAVVIFVFVVTVGAARMPTQGVIRRSRRPRCATSPAQDDVQALFLCLISGRRPPTPPWAVHLPFLSFFSSPSSIPFNNLIFSNAAGR